MSDDLKSDALAPRPITTAPRKPGRGRPPKHGITSWVNSKRLPYGRTFQRVRRELSVLQEDLLEAHGGRAASPEAKILIDSIIEGLGVQKLAGLYVRRFGVVNGAAANKGHLRLNDLLGKNWVSYANVVRQGVLALKEIEKARPASPQAEIEAILTSYAREDPPEVTGLRLNGSIPASQADPLPSGETAPGDEPAPNPEEERRS